MPWWVLPIRCNTTSLFLLERTALSLDYTALVNDCMISQMALLYTKSNSTYNNINCVSGWTIQMHGTHIYIRVPPFPLKNNEGIILYYTMGLVLSSVRVLNIWFDSVYGTQLVDIYWCAHTPIIQWVAYHYIWTKLKPTCCAAFYQVLSSLLFTEWLCGLWNVRSDLQKQHFLR